MYRCLVQQNITLTLRILEITRETCHKRQLTIREVHLCVVYCNKLEPNNLSDRQGFCTSSGDWQKSWRHAMLRNLGDGISVTADGLPWSLTGKQQWDGKRISRAKGKRGKWRRKWIAVAFFARQESLQKHNSFHRPEPGMARGGKNWFLPLVLTGLNRLAETPSG